MSAAGADGRRHPAPGDGRKVEESDRRGRVAALRRNTTALAVAGVALALIAAVLLLLPSLSPSAAVAWGAALVMVLQVVTTLAVLRQGARTSAADRRLERAVAVVRSDQSRFAYTSDRRAANVLEKVEALSSAADATQIAISAVREALDVPALEPLSRPGAALDDEENLHALQVILAQLVSHDRPQPMTGLVLSQPSGASQRTTD